MDRVAVHCDGLRILEFLDVVLGEDRPLHLKRQLIELGGQRERRRVVGIVHTGKRVGADVEALVPLQDHRQRALHRLCRHHLAIHLKGAGAGSAETAHVVVGKRSHPEAVILEVELDGVTAGGQRIRTFPLDTLEVDQVPQEHRFAL
jgi:hypothetical protein